MFYVFLYLMAVVLANLLVAHFGPSSVIIVAFLFIGLDLTSRDKLHDAWSGNGLFWKMALLIATGSTISWFLNRDAGRIALASFLAFCAAGIVDAIVYHTLHKKSWMVKVNGSNIFSAAVDSIVFPTVAFGVFMPLIILGQFAAKVLGGFVWAWVISRWHH